jgi:uncharacterized protein YbaP (TraB family)
MRNSLRQLQVLFLALIFCLSSAYAAPSLWQVDAVEGKGRAYLFGSIHFGHQDIYPLSDTVMRAFRRSRELMVEIDLNRVDPGEASRILMEYGRSPIGVTLEEHLPTAKWQQLQQVSQQLGIPTNNLQRLKPWLVAIQLAAAQVRQSGFGEEYGIDRYFVRLAKVSQPAKPILQLESFSDQMSLFDDLDHDSQLDFLSQTLTDFEQGSGYLENIINAWRAGDETSLDQAIKGAFDGDLEHELYQRLFGERNRRMFSSLQAEIDAGTVVFMVVGAGHIVGDDGIRALLQNAGYRVKRLQ